MRLVLALFIPSLLFFTISRPWAGLLCLLMQMSVIGWIPAAFWALSSLELYNSDKRIEAALNRIKFDQVEI